MSAIERLLMTTDESEEQQEGSNIDFIERKEEEKEESVKEEDNTQKIEPEQKEDDKITLSISRNETTVSPKQIENLVHNYEKHKIYKRQYMKNYNARKKRELQELKERVEGLERQLTMCEPRLIKGISITMISSSNLEPTTRKITNEKAYKETIDDLLATVKDLGAIANYNIQPLVHRLSIAPQQ